MEFRKWNKSLAARLQAPEGRGYTSSLLNLSAPSISTTNDYVSFGSCASTLVQGQNLMAVLMPQLANKKGQLALAGWAVEVIFLNSALQMEQKWALVSNQKPDSRDNRSLVSDGR